MKILALTDVHGAYELCEKIIEKEQPDLVIIGGDLTNIGTVKEAENALAKFRTHQQNLFAVAGNMDLPQHDELFVKLGVSLNGRGVVHDGVGFFGVSASPHSRLRTPYEISEEEIAETLKSGYADVSACKVKVMVPHAPPYGTKVDIIHSGYHVGSTAVREFIEELQPDAVICGHIHEARGQDHIDKTKIVNCGYGRDGCFALLEVDKGKVEIHSRIYK